MVSLLLFCVVSVGPNEADRFIYKLAHPQEEQIVYCYQLAGQLSLWSEILDSCSHGLVCAVAEASQSMGLVLRGRKQKTSVFLTIWPQPGITSFLLYFNSQRNPRPAKIQEGEGIDCIWQETGIRELLLFRHPVVSDTLWPFGLQNARSPCPSPSPEVWSSSCPCISDAI